MYPYLVKENKTEEVWIVLGKSKGRVFLANPQTKELKCIYWAEWAVRYSFEKLAEVGK